MTKITLSFAEYLRRQIEEILSPENLWFAGEKLRHSPTRQEAAAYYVECGAAKRFAEKYAYEQPKDSD